MKYQDQAKTISMISLANEVTTQSDAEIYGCFGTYLVKLSEEEKIAYTKAGKHLRIKFEGVIK